MPPLTPPTRCADRTSGRCRGCGRVVTGRDGAPGSPPWPSESPGSSPRRLRVLPLHLSEAAAAAAAAARAGQRLGPAGPESGGWRAPVRRDRQYADARSGARGAVRDSGAPAGGTAPSGAGAIPQAARPARRWPRLPEWTSKTGARDLPVANKPFNPRTRAVPLASRSLCWAGPLFSIRRSSHTELQRKQAGEWARKRSSNQALA